MSKELRNGKLKSTDDHKHINDYFTHKVFMKMWTILIIIGSRVFRERLSMMIRVVDENLHQLLQTKQQSNKATDKMRSVLYHINTSSIFLDPIIEGVFYLLVFT